MIVRTPSTRILDMEGDYMRGQMLRALQNHAKANIELHTANIEIYLRNPVGVGEHSDVMEAVQAELDKLTVHADRLDTLQHHFNND